MCGKCCGPCGEADFLWWGKQLWNLERSMGAWLPYTLKIDVPQRTRRAECLVEILCASIKFTVRRSISSISSSAKTFTFIYAPSCEDGRSLVAILSSHGIVIHFIFTQPIISRFSLSLEVLGIINTLNLSLARTPAARLTLSKSLISSIQFHGRLRSWYFSRY